MPTPDADAASAPRPPETLKFTFTPVGPPRPDPDGTGAGNPHAQPTTHLPDLADALRAALGDAVTGEESYAGETTVFVAKDRVADVARWLYAQGFTYLSDLGGIDRFTEEDRFEVFYNLLDLDRSRRLRVKTRVDEAAPTLPSVTPVWRAAAWHEREAWDMFGLRFEGHEDLRRMYLPEDFEYHPLRKEFPLLGIPGSLPLPSGRPSDDLQYDPFPAAHGDVPVKSYEEPGLPD